MRWLRFIRMKGRHNLGCPVLSMLRLLSLWATGPLVGDRAQRDRAALLVQDAANQRPEDYLAIHLLGQYYLSIGDVDEAVTQFRKAQERAPNDARILNDLGGALIEKTRGLGVTSTDSVLLDECVRALNRALEIDPALPEAYFYRALCNELLMQWQSAEADWQSYLQLDSTSPWAAEARAGLQRIEEQKRRSAWDGPRIFDDFIDAAAHQNEEAGWRLLSISIGTRSSHIVERLIDESLNAQVDEDKKHEMLLKWAGQIALAGAGDPFITDVAHRYATTSVSDRRELKEARRRLSDGVALFRVWRLRDACGAFESAALQFDELGDSAEASYARYLEAHCYLRLPDLERARRLFDHVRQTASLKGYRWLESRADDGLAELHFYPKRVLLGESNSLGVLLSCHASWVTLRASAGAALNFRRFIRNWGYAEAGNFAWEGLETVNKQVRRSAAELPSLRGRRPTFTRRLDVQRWPLFFNLRACDAPISQGTQ